MFRHFILKKGTIIFESDINYYLQVVYILCKKMGLRCERCLIKLVKSLIKSISKNIIFNLLHMSEKVIEFLFI